MIRPGDLLVALAGAALVAWLASVIYTSAPASIVRITQADQPPRDYRAAEDRIIRIEGPLGETVIEVKEERARIVRSPCTQKLCMRTGWLEASGDAAACLPNRISVALLGGDAGLDAVTF